jgi:DNA repair exonuclease SbcCD ATPase subunit
MSKRPISEIDEDLLPEVERQLDELVSAYETARRAAEESEELFEFEPYFSVDFGELLEELKRARQWEYKLDAYQRDLLSVRQLVEQVDDGAAEIRKWIRMADGSLDRFADTVEKIRDAVSDDSDLAARLDVLRDEVETQQRQLDELDELLTHANKSAKNASISWMD